jgi:FkbM family methyltransferase
MLSLFIRDAAVKLFGLVAKLGLQRLPLFNRAFLALYAIYKEHFEAGPIDRLEEFVPAGSLVIDVGANVGFFTLRFARWVGDRGKVLAIEPEDRNYASLLAAIEREGFSGRVEPLKAVAAATPGEIFLEINPVHPADHKISRDGTGLPVHAVTLDRLVLDKAGLRPALVKIDVQGAEMMVLKGAAGLLGSAQPALFIELDEAALNRFGSSITAILDHLLGYGYEPYWLARTGAPRKTNPTEIHAAAGRSGYVDVLFLKARLPGNPAPPQ